MEIKQQQFISERDKRQIIDIYDHSFPESERIDFHLVQTKIESQDSLLFTAHSDAQIVGFGIVNSLSCRWACLLEYLAIDNSKRSLGIGSKLLSHIVKALSSDDHTLGILLEVEPTEGAPPKELSIRRKRIAFYQRFGATTLEKVPNYCIPDLSNPGHIHMLLMWLPVKNEKSELTNSQLRECITNIYIDIYSADENDKKLNSLLESLR